MSVPKPTIEEFAQQADGELPAEILASFPVGKQFELQHPHFANDAAGGQVIGKMEAGASVYIRYQHTQTVYYLLPDDRFSTGYISAMRVELDCHNIHYPPSD